MIEFKSTLKVIGSGLIARNISHTSFPDGTLIIASGVSNSKETRVSAFIREQELIKQAIYDFSGARVVYFSTCSISSGEVSEYIQHKINMEKLISELCDNYWIFRLPQVVGDVKNTTLVSFLFNAIKTGQKIKIQAKAKRNLIDIYDVIRVASALVSKSLSSGDLLNIASSQSVPVTEIVDEIARLLAIPAITEVSNEGYSHEIDISSLYSVIPFNDPLFENDYWKRVLLKYSAYYKKN